MFNWENNIEEVFPGPIQVGVTFLGFLSGNFNVIEQGRPPKVGIHYENGEDV